jgi:hypothetical protein
MKLIAGERILAGDWITVGSDGKAYRCKFNIGESPVSFSKDDHREGVEFKGSIPPIAEKEKRGKRFKVPKNEIYVQELQTKTGINHGNN